MELLLFLSALLSGLTGVISGERPAERAPVQQGVVALAGQLAERIMPSAVKSAERPCAPQLDLGQNWVVKAALPADIRRLSERRLQ